jgi:uncharacterized Rmd1/YagE family protein
MFWRAAAAAAAAAARRAEHAARRRAGGGVRLGLAIHETPSWTPAVRRARLCTASSRWQAPFWVVSGATGTVPYARVIDVTTTRTQTQTANETHARRSFASSSQNHGADPHLPVFSGIETDEEIAASRDTETQPPKPVTPPTEKPPDLDPTGGTFRQNEYAVPVRAYYVGNSVDFHGLAKRLPTYPKEFFRECVVVRMTPRVGSGAGGSGDSGIVTTPVTSPVGASTIHQHLENQKHGGDLRDGIHPGERAFAGRKSGRKARKDGASELESELSSEFREGGGDLMGHGVRQAGSHDGQGNPNPTETPRYFVVYNYGSVVFFNMGRREREECLKLVRSFCPKPLPVPCTDDYRVMVRPGLEPWALFEADHVVLKRLDLNNISVIGTVLAQTVALEHHELKVDNMIEIFSGLNKTTYETGEMDISKNKLFKLVAENNNTLTELVTRMRLLGRSDTAWQYAQYDKVWNGLRKDFELEDRFDHLDYKLNLIQTQVKFYLEILQNRKSDTLEWIIILLISMEICVSLYDMSTKIG